MKRRGGARTGPAGQAPGRRPKPKRGGKAGGRDARAQHTARAQPSDRRPRPHGHAHAAGAHARGQHARGSAAAADPAASRALNLAPRPPEVERSLAQLAAATDPPAPGDWLWTTREGAERDCIEELVLGHALQARGLVPSLVLSDRGPPEPSGRLELTFARQGFAISALAREPEESQLAAALAEAASQLVHGERYALHVFVPDSERGNRLAQRADRISEQLQRELARLLPEVEPVADGELRRQSVELIQVCLFAPDLAALGVMPSDRALSIWPGGRARMRVSADRPSRAARKLEEALAWLGTAPGAGEACVDLGAAPGGWSWLLLNRKARVIAVDPAKLDPDLLGQRRLRHVQSSAFDWHPDEPVDWLFCDMAWRPLEVAQMLARWARRRQTRMLVSNFKLPMKRKAEIVARIRELLEQSGYEHVRTRQLYHDREEITLTARVR